MRTSACEKPGIRYTKISTRPRYIEDCNRNGKRRFAAVKTGNRDLTAEVLGV